jgi:hypothetical protein
MNSGIGGRMRLKSPPSSRHEPNIGLGDEIVDRRRRSRQKG